MNRQPPPASRRRVLPAGAGTAAALLGPSPGDGTAAAAGLPRAGAAEVLQPYASYGFPDSLPSGTPGHGITRRSLAAWTPGSDRDLAFNTATVPLAERFTPVPANTTARAGQARISALAAFDHTAGSPPQGSATADHYAPTPWAYLDELVFWGGSSGEGLILAPNAPVVDAAHRHGVPVLGTVFLPPVAYGGQLRWTRDLVQQDAAGRFPLAAKPVQVATGYGFDGWFLTAETGGGDAALAADMQAFLRALRIAGAGHGLRITWLRAMNTTGQVGWQGALDLTHRLDPASGPVTAEVAPALREAPAPGEPAPYCYLPAGTLTAGGGRRTTSLGPGSLGPGTVHALGVRLTGHEDTVVAWRPGALAVHEGAVSPAAPSGPKVTDTVTADGAVPARLSRRRATAPVRHYALHPRFPGGKRDFLGGTCRTAFSLPGLRRAQNEPAAPLEVHTVHELFTVSMPSETRLLW
ncbi:hypothetical protein [Streptomyces sp. NPDC015125]|uniref:endo-beta-N-acetylglucosaminidase n=1 Tax=Streptomyces sp. NPDC015125 TaxID=3364938 RepID=UPI0036FEC5A5